MYIRQPEALGLGHAVLCAKQIVGDDPFAVILADDLISHGTGVVRQMVELYNRHHCSVIGVENISREDTGSYGILGEGPARCPPGFTRWNPLSRNPSRRRRLRPWPWWAAIPDAGYFRFPRKRCAPVPAAKYSSPTA